MHKNILRRYVCGLLAGVFISALIINWFPSKEPALWSAREGSPPNLYEVTTLINNYAFISFPIIWPTLFAQHSVNFGCSSDSESTGCYGTMTEINNGRIYIFILLALYCGFLAVYWPVNKKIKLNAKIQVSIFIANLLGVLIPFFLLFPEIIEHNSISLTSPIIIILLPLYLPVSLFTIYEIAKKKVSTNLIKLIGFIISLLLIVFYGYFFFLLILMNTF